MEYVGIDLHKRDSQICWLTEDGEVREQRIRTTAARFVAVFGGRPRARVLIEASTESEWVAQGIESVGHEVIVADPGYAPMYPRRGRRQKNDRRDAGALAIANRTGTYRAVHRVSAAQRQVRAVLTVRDQLVAARTRLIAVVRALARGEGVRVPSCATEGVVPQVEAAGLPPALAATVAPLLDTVATLTAGIEASEARLAGLTADDPRVAALQSAPSVGTITAAAFVATLDEGRALPRRGPGGGLSGPRAPGAQLRRDTSLGADHESGLSTHALAAGPGGVASLTLEAGGRPAPAPVGHGDRRPSRESPCGRRDRAATGADSFCAAAGWGALRHGP